MNLREGTRRLALLLGAAGMIFGGFVSYLELTTLIDQQAHHQRFEQLANSEIVQQEHKRQTGWNTINPKTQEADDWYQVINSGGISNIHWSKDNEIESIGTPDGQILFPTPAPSIWLYFVAVLFPVLGFFIPWGLVRAIGWVVAGFVQPLK